MLGRVGVLAPTRRRLTAVHQGSVAIVAGTLALALVAASLILAALNGYDLWRLNYLLFVVSCALVGALLASRQPSNPVGWLYLTGAVSFGLMEFTGHYALYGLVTQPGSLPGARWVAWPQTWLAIPAVIPVMTLVPLYFPDGKLLSPRWRPFRNALIVYCIGAAVLSAFSPGAETIQVGAEAGVINPVGLPGLAFLAPVLDAVMPVLFLGTGLFANASLFIRFKRSRGEQRQQIKYFAFAAGILTVLLIAERIYYPAGFLGASLLAAMPLSVGLAVLRFRLYDIDLVVNRTIVFSALTAVLLAIYVAVVGVLGRLMAEWTSFAVSAVGAGAVAVCFAPIKDRLQKGINRLMFGERGEPSRVLARLGERLQSAIDPESVLPTIVHTIAEALKLRFAAIEVMSGGAWRLAARFPSDGAVDAEDAIRLPLSYQGETEARLILAARSRGDEFSPRHRALLEEINQPIAVAVHAISLKEQALRLSADLQASRERLVGAREEERRRLRRDLHDGLGPQLAALTMKTEAARDLVASDPGAATALLNDVIERSLSAVSEVRRVVYALAPPALDALGLVGAVRSLAAGHTFPGFSVQVDAAGDLPPLPAAVESAAYFIINEALSNSSKHSGGTACRVKLWVDEEAWTLNGVVSDNGSGMRKGHSTGVGLLSMRERAAELGGACLVGSQPALGVKVEVTLPISGRSGTAETSGGGEI